MNGAPHLQTYDDIVSSLTREDYETPRLVTFQDCLTFFVEHAQAGEPDIYVGLVRQNADNFNFLDFEFDSDPSGDVLTEVWINDDGQIGNFEERVLESYPGSTYQQIDPFTIDLSTFIGKSFEDL